MKKILVVILSLSLIIGLTACSEKSAPPAEKQDEIEVPPIDEKNWNIVEEIQTPMDVAIYRGTVKSVEEGFIFTLQQYEGANYGAEQLKIVITSETMLTEEPSKIAVGDYLEVSYGGDTNEKVGAITVKNLGKAENLVINGEIVEIYMEEEGEGSFLIKDIHTNYETRVNYNKNGETQFYLEEDYFKEGYNVNIFYSGIQTRSMPPQIFALEIRRYKSDDEIKEEIQERQDYLESVEIPKE